MCSVMARPGEKKGNRELSGCDGHVHRLDRSGSSVAPRVVSLDSRVVREVSNGACVPTQMVRHFAPCSLCDAGVHSECSSSSLMATSVLTIHEEAFRLAYVGMFMFPRQNSRARSEEIELFSLALYSNIYNTKVLYCVSAKSETCHRHESEFLYKSIQYN